MLNSLTGSVVKCSWNRVLLTNVNEMVTPSTRLSELTVQELLDFIEMMGRQESSRPIIGVKGLAEFLGCSYATALRLKQSGRLDKAMVRTGRTIRFDRRKVEAILK